MTAPLRKYHCPDVVMFTASETIVKQCVNNYDVLVEKRKTWENPYFPNLLLSLTEGRERILGKDAARLLREATREVKTEQSSVLSLLSEFKIQFDVDFDGELNKGEILKSLGFTDYYKKAVKGNQEALVEMLSKFKTNISAELENTITGKGMDPGIITSIKGYAGTFGDSNTNQETAKGTKVNLSAETINELNGYYKTIIGICKIAHNKFKGNPQKQALFSFDKTVKNIYGNKGNGGTDTPPELPTPPAN